MDIVLNKFKKTPYKEQGYDMSLLKPGAPVLFRYRNTNVTYHPSLFHLGLVQGTGSKNLRSSRNIIVGTVKNGKIIKDSVFVEDIILLQVSPKGVEVSEEELVSLGMQ